MTQTNLCMKQKQTHKLENGQALAKREGCGGRIRILGLAEANYYIQDG